MHNVRNITPKHPSRKTQLYYICGTNSNNSLISTETAEYRIADREDFSCLTTARNQQENVQVIFDFDSFLIGINNHAYGIIYNHKHQFVSEIKPLPHQKIRVISGSVTIKEYGTFKWNIDNDESKIYPLEIKDTLYVPD